MNRTDSRDLVGPVGRIRRNAVIGHEPPTALGRLRCANPPYVSPWYANFVAVALLAICNPVHADPSLGRLFNTPAERSALDANRGKAAAAAARAAPASAFTPSPVEGLPPGVPGNMSPPPAQAMMPPGADTGMPAETPAPPPAPEQLELNGLVRSSSGRSTVWLNNVPQSGPQNKFSNRNKKALTVTLPSGKKVLLRPGQRYDLADGRVKDINEP